MNIITYDRIGLQRYFDEWLKTLPAIERPSSQIVIGTSKDLRPMFMNMPEAFVDCLRKRNFDFDVEA